jgi:hypothetical protein
VSVPLAPTTFITITVGLPPLRWAVIVPAKPGELPLVKDPVPKMSVLVGSEVVHPFPAVQLAPVTSNKLKVLST